MRYWHCLSCHRKYQTFDKEQMLKCRCGEYEEHLLIEVDKNGYPIKKRND